MRQKWILCGWLLSLILPLGGCWSYSELNDRAIIAGAAIDRMESGELRLTVETVDFSEGQSTGAKSELLSGVGGSVPEAIFTIMNQSQKELYWHHATLLLLGQSYAEEGIAELLDYILKEHEMRLTLTLAVSRLETAAEVLELECHGSAIRSFGITGIIEEQDRLGQTVRADAYQVLDTRLGEKLDFAVPQIGSVQRGDKASVDVSGCGVFSGDRLAGWLEADESRFIKLLQGDLKEAEVDLMTEREAVSLRTMDWVINPPKSEEESMIGIQTTYELLSGNRETREEDIRLAMEYYVNHNLQLLQNDLREMDAKLFDWMSDGTETAVCQIKKRER